MIPLTNEENESYLKQKVCHICKKEFFFDIDCSEGVYIVELEITIIVLENTEVLLRIFVI